MRKHVLILLFCTLINSAACVAMKMGDIIRINNSISHTASMIVHIINPTSTDKKPSRSPIKAPSISYDGNTIFLYGQFKDVILQLQDNGKIVYSTDIPANANEVVLPNCESGIYDLQLNDGTYIYSCELEFE